MDSALSPREIQSRIRSGDSLEAVARMAGIPPERVERFAAPVIAEREHIAAMAMASSVRRRGETSGHRNLRIALTERLVARGVDIDTVAWDSFRLEDGRWQVTARYRSGEAERSAAFAYDVRGRFSVADNDDARWVLGEQSPAKGPQPGRRRPVAGEGGGEDEEPTLDLSDELALVRAVQGDSAPAGADAPAGRDAPAADTGQLASVRELRRDRVVEPQAGPSDRQPSTGDEADAVTGADDPAVRDVDSQLDVLDQMLDGENRTRTGRATMIDVSDAAAVPETVEGGWHPPVAGDYPVEPEPEDADPEAQPEPESHAAPTPEAEPAPKSVKRTRAAVPSWDEIMFGSAKKTSE